MPGDADHECRKQQRRDDGLDEIQKNQAEHPKLNGGSRPIVTDLGSGSHRHKYPRRHGFPFESETREGGDGEPPDKDHLEDSNALESRRWRHTHHAPARTTVSPITKSNRWKSVLSVSLLSHSSPSFC